MLDPALFVVAKERNITDGCRVLFDRKGRRVFGKVEYVWLGVEEVAHVRLDDGTETNAHLEIDNVTRWEPASCPT